MAKQSEKKPLKLIKLEKKVIRLKKVNSVSKSSASKPITLADVLRDHRMLEKKRSGRLETFSDGYDLMDEPVKKWNSQPNPPKVYLKGHRIHHGLVGFAMSAIGLIADYQPLVGMGARLMVDDIADLPDWFNFQK